MSSPPSPRTFEGLIAEEWWGPGALLNPAAMALLEPYRERIDALLDDFDEETMSWRDYCGCIWGYWNGDDGALPRAVVAQVQALLASGGEERDAVATGLSALGDFMRGVGIARYVIR